MSYTASVITVSDLGSRGLRQDTSGPAVRAMLEDGEELHCEEIIRAAAERRISRRTVNEAKKNISGIVTRKAGARWLWSMEKEDCNIAEVSLKEG